MRKNEVAVFIHVPIAHMRLVCKRKNKGTCCTLRQLLLGSYKVILFNATNHCDAIKVGGQPCVGVCCRPPYVVHTC